MNTNKNSGCWSEAVFGGYFLSKRVRNGEVSHHSFGRRPCRLHDEHVAGLGCKKAEGTLD